MIKDNNNNSHVRAALVLHLIVNWLFADNGIGTFDLKTMFQLLLVLHDVQEREFTSNKM